MVFQLLLFLISANVYYRDVTIINPCDSLQNDVQVKFVLDTRSLIGTNRLDEHGNSLRLYRNQIPVGSWIEQGINSCSTSIWLKMDSLFPGENRLTMVYSDTTDRYVPVFDSVFTKFFGAEGYCFHCDEGIGEAVFSSDSSTVIQLFNMDWKSRDGGGWGDRKELTFSNGSSLYINRDGFGCLNIPEHYDCDSFTYAFWISPDTMGELCWSSEIRTISECPEAFSINIQRGQIIFTAKGTTSTKSCTYPPFGWERVGSPALPAGFIPQGLTAYNGYLLLSAYSKSQPQSVVYKIDANDLTILDWFVMPEEATHTSGLAYDSTKGILWATDYDSGKIYAIDVEESFLSHVCQPIGKFNLNREGVSACCLVLFHDTLRLMVSTYSETGRNYILDQNKSLNNGKPFVLGFFRNTISSQGLAFDGRYVWESSNSVMAKYDLQEAVAGNYYQAGLVSYYSEPLLVEDIAFLEGVLWTSSEESSRNFYRLVEDPRDFLDRWMHVAVSYDRKWLRIYRDGWIEDSCYINDLKLGGNGRELFIGSSNNDYTSFEGSIDEIILLPYVIDSSGLRAIVERRKETTIEPQFHVGESEDTISYDDVVENLANKHQITINTCLSKISLNVPYEQETQVDLFDTAGRRITCLLARQAVIGRIELDWPSGLSSGIYYVMVRNDRKTFAKKVILFK